MWRNISGGVLLGDSQNGKHGTFLKFTPVSQPAPFAHLRLLRVVVKGVMSNPEKDEKDSPLPSGPIGTEGWRAPLHQWSFEGGLHHFSRERWKFMPGIEKE